MARVRLSRRERLLQSKRTLDFIAASADKPYIFQTQIPKARIRRPVDGKPAGPSEHQEQAAVIDWWRHVHMSYGLPVFALFAIPNGGARDAITGARLKAEGVRRGTPDLMLAAANFQYRGLFIELKVGDNKPSPEQQEFIHYLKGAGYKAVVHWSALAAMDEIIGYLESE